MNAKEKAQDLFTTFRYALSHKDAPLGMYKDNIAIQCALMAVEEILKCEATEPSDTDWDDCGATAQYYWPQKKVDAGKFWGDVKSELQSL
jgi:hypothetical protein